MIIIKLGFSFSRGSDFRNSFDKIGGLRALTDVPIIAVTATAPKAVESMICDSLSLQTPVVVSQSLDRPNIFLSCTKSRGLNVSVCNENGNFIGFLTYPYFIE